MSNGYLLHIDYFYGGRSHVTSAEASGYLLGDARAALEMELGSLAMKHVEVRSIAVIRYPGER